MMPSKAVGRRRGLGLMALLLIPCLLWASGHGVAESRKPAGEMRWALYVTISPAWFDPGAVVGVYALLVLYASA